MTQYIQQLAYDFFSVTSFWSVVFRALIWIVISVLILIATDQPKPEVGKQNVKSYLGFFLLFMLVSTSMVLLLFGMSPA